MTVADDTPSRRTNGRGGRKRAKVHRVLHGCHLRAEELRKLAETAIGGLTTVEFRTELSVPGESSKSTEISESSLADLLEIVHREAGGQAKRLENLTIRSDSRNHRRVHLCLTRDRVEYEVQAEPGDDDWVDGRDARLRKILERSRSRCRVPGRARVQVPVGAAAGAMSAMVLAFAVAGYHPRVLGFALLVAAGCLLGSLAGAVSAHCRRTVVVLKERPSIGGRNVPTPAEAALIVLAAASLAVAIVALVLTPATQDAVPPPAHHAIMSSK